jgi:hypothetical protein
MVIRVYGNESEFDVKRSCCEDLRVRNLGTHLPNAVEQSSSDSLLIRLACNIEIGNSKTSE